MTPPLSAEVKRRVLMRGIGAAAGVAIGCVHLVDRRKNAYPRFHTDDHPQETARFDAAVEVARNALDQIRQRVEGEPMRLLDAHLLMLEDPLLRQRVVAAIETEQKNAEWALRSAITTLKREFDALADDYFRERRSDVDFVGERIMSALMAERSQVDDVPNDAVVVAHDISPADTVALMKKNLRAIVTEAGGVTSHTAILARALKIPAVAGCKKALARAGNGDDIVVDGGAGHVILHPSRRLLRRYQSIAHDREVVATELLGEVEFPPTTPDGHAIEILANVELEREVASVLAMGATGIGLYRTEFLFLRKAALPSESEHRRVYGHVLDAVGRDRRVVFRTFDLGSDKLAPKLKMPREDNPALGLRACRLGVVHEKLFRKQLRAILRACADGGGAIMFPMISGVSELRHVLGILDDEKEKLAKAGERFAENIPVGTMIELPSAVWVADALAKEVDFFSVGTNDLLQYSLAADRNNEHVAYLYRPLHLSNLRALRHVIEAAKDANISVCLCGEMAADPLCAAVSMGLGFDSLSMPPSAIPQVKWALRRFPIWDAKALVEDCFRKTTSDQIEALAREALAARVPEILRFADGTALDEGTTTQAAERTPGEQAREAGGGLSS